MKKFFTIVCFIFTICHFEAYSQTYQVDTLYKTGSIDDRVNIVILGDGFTKEEMPKFATEAKKFSEFFLEYAPYNRYKNYFNFFGIQTPSKESGVTNPGTAPDVYTDQPVGVKDTFYGASFGTQIHRLVTVAKYDVMYNVLATNFPSYDLVVVLVNTTWYGGSGGSVAVHTLNVQANTIGVHEIGHTFSHLNDEYWAGPGYGWEAPNMTMTSDPASIKWRNWLNTNNVGIYQHGADEAALWYKPTSSNCLMELLDKQLCNVCVEATTERILQVVNPVENVQPDTIQDVALSEEEQIFILGLLKPEPNSLQVEWRLEGKLIASGKEQISLSGMQLADATGLLTATVFDSTGLSRKDGIRSERTRSVNWNLRKSNVPPIFKLTMSTDTICLGSSSILTASGCPGIISWSNAQTGKSITVNPGETAEYTTSCKTDGMDSVSLSAKIVVVPLPVAAATNDGPYFEGATIQLNAGGGDSYQWTGPENFTSQLQNPTIAFSTVNNAGLYEVKVTGMRGCLASAQTVVEVDPILAVNPFDSEIVISPNPAKDNIHIKTSLIGNSVFKLYNLNGQKVSEKSFIREMSLPLNNLNAGMYLYRLNNGVKEISGKVMVQ